MEYIRNTTIVPDFSSVKRSLYVGDLNPDVQESDLLEKFSPVGPISSIRVCRMIGSHRSLGYAYVNFINGLDAEKALDTLNFENILGRPMRIMWSQRDPSLRKSGKGNVFIKNLHPSIDNKSLLDTFSPFGCILSAKVIYGDNGSKGYGFVHFENEKSAEDAIKKVNGMMMKDKKVYVGQFIHKRDRVREKYKFNNVYVKNFGRDWKDEDLHAYFKNFGDIVSAKVMLDEWGMSRGFGFVCYESPANAENAVKSVNGVDIGGRRLYAGRAQKKEERKQFLKEKFLNQTQGRKTQYPGFNLYIRNLDPRVNEERLHQEFLKFGQINSSRVMTHNGESKGYGFVCFAEKEAAERAVREMDGSILIERKLSVTFASTKEERRRSAFGAHSLMEANRFLPQNTNFFMQQFVDPTHCPPPIHINNVPRLQSPLIPPMTNPVNFNMGAPNRFGFKDFTGRHAVGQPMGFKQGITAFKTTPKIENAQLYSPHPQHVPGLPLQHQYQNAPLMHHAVNPAPQYRAPRMQFSSLVQTTNEAPKKTDNRPAVPPRFDDQSLRDRLFWEVKKINSVATRKITDVLLEMNFDVARLLESPRLLQEKIRDIEIALSSGREKIVEVKKGS